MAKIATSTINGIVISLGMSLLLMLMATNGQAQKFSPYGNPIRPIAIEGVEIRVEVVESPDKIYQGLSGRKALPEGTGMLFRMPSRQYRHFCMRGMLVPLDIIWIADGKIIGLDKNISPQDQRTFSSPAPATLVLEVPGGFCDKYGIKQNDKVNWVK